MDWGPSDARPRVFPGAGRVRGVRSDRALARMAPKGCLRLTLTLSRWVRVGGCCSRSEPPASGRCPFGGRLGSGGPQRAPTRRRRDAGGKWTLIGVGRAGASVSGLACGGALQSEAIGAPIVERHAERAVRGVVGELSPGVRGVVLGLSRESGRCSVGNRANDRDGFGIIDRGAKVVDSAAQPTEERDIDRWLDLDGCRTEGFAARAHPLQCGAESIELGSEAIQSRLELGRFLDRDAPQFDVCATLNEQRIDQRRDPLGEQKDGVPAVAPAAVHPLPPIGVRSPRLEQREGEASIGLELALVGARLELGGYQCIELGAGDALGRFVRFSHASITPEPASLSTLLERRAWIGVQWALEQRFRSQVRGMSAESGAEG